MATEKNLGFLRVFPYHHPVCQEIALEQRTVVLLHYLRKMSDRRARVGNEPEAVSWRWRKRGLRRWCLHGQVDSSGGFDGVCSEGRAVIERPRIRNALPSNTKRAYHRTDKP